MMSDDEVVAYDVPRGSSFYTFPFFFHNFQLLYVDRWHQEASIFYGRRRRRDGETESGEKEHQREKEAREIHVYSGKMETR